MPPNEFNQVRALFNQMTAGGSRSTVLGPIGWMMPICVLATLASVEYEAPAWLTEMFAAFTALTFLLYLIAYVYCLFTDKDALRSERYSIQKMAIEKGLIGDDNIGLIPAEEYGPGKILQLSVEDKTETVK